MCKDTYGEKLPVEYLEKGTYLEVLFAVRDYIQKGWTLETHPMTGSLKPNQTPYKSILISDRHPDREEFYMQEITIENGILACEKFQAVRKTPDWSERLREDFMAVDLDLISSAVQKILS